MYGVSHSRPGDSGWDNDGARAERERANCGLREHCSARDFGDCLGTDERAGSERSATRAPAGCPPAAVHPSEPATTVPLVVSSHLRP
jgi:hypothetical protein